MPQIIVNNQSFDVDGIVFDKDGTLIDFHATWGPVLRSAVERLVEPFDDAPALADNVFRTMGVDPTTLRAGDGPYATTTMDKIYTIVTTVLYQHGMAWTQAEQRVHEIFKAAAESSPPREMLAPTTDLPVFFSSLESGNINTAIATADNRRGTLEMLANLDCNVDRFFFACGDDAGLPSKPDPQLLHTIAEHWNTTTNRIAMVGDTVGDVYMAQQAGAISIGVLTGAGTTPMLAPYCDVVIDSIAQINVRA